MQITKKHRKAWALSAGSKTGKLKKKHIVRLKAFLRRNQEHQTNAAFTADELKELGVE
jgi:hypothetical protein